MTPIFILLAATIAGVAVSVALFAITSLPFKPFRSRRWLRIALPIFGGFGTLASCAGTLVHSEAELDAADGFYQAFGQPLQAEVKITRAFGQQDFDFFGIFLKMQTTNAGMHLISSQQKLSVHRADQVDDGWPAQPSWWTARPNCQGAQYYLPDPDLTSQFSWDEASATEFSYLFVARCPNGLTYALAWDI